MSAARTQLLLAAAIVPVAAAIGVVIAVAGSPGSLSGGLVRSQPHGSSVASATKSSPAATPSPAKGTGVQAAGRLGERPRLLALPGGTVAAGDGSSFWLIRAEGDPVQLTPPPDAAGLALDPVDASRMLAGGQGAQASGDGGHTWHRPRSSPPGPGPFVPLLMNPDDPTIWFLLHQGRIARTRDDGQTWRDLFNPGQLASAQLVPAGQNRFVLGSGARVYLLEDNGQNITDRGSLPDGVEVAGLAAGSGSGPALFVRGSNQHLYANTGGSWTEISAPLPGPVAVAGDSRVWVADGAGRLGEQGKVAYSTDGGATFKLAQGLPADQSVQTIAAEPPGDVVYAYCFGGDIYRSTDAGQTFAPMSKAFRAG